MFLVVVSTKTLDVATQHFRCIGHMIERIGMPNLSCGCTHNSFIGLHRFYRVFDIPIWIPTLHLDDDDDDDDDALWGGRVY